MCYRNLWHIVVSSAAAEAAAEQTTLIHNEEESFALAPIEASVIKVTKFNRDLIVLCCPIGQSCGSDPFCTSRPARIDRIRHIKIPV
jgi:hypothetical protein